MKKAKGLAVLVSGVLIGTCLITGTLAWFTDEKAVMNTFTVGNISMILDEQKIEDATIRVQEGQKYKIIPGTQLAKDPRVTIEAGSEDSYVFISVENTLNTVVENATSFYHYKGEEKVEGMDPTWVVIGHIEGQTILQYQGDKAKDHVVTGGTILEEVFDGVKVHGEVVTADNIEALQSETITVKAFAHQSAHIEEAVVQAAAISHFSK